MHETSDFLFYNNLFIYQVLCTLIYRRRSLYSFLIHVFVEHGFVLHTYVWVKPYYFIEDIIWAVLNIGVIILAPMLLMSTQNGAGSFFQQWAISLRCKLHLKRSLIGILLTLSKVGHVWYSGSSQMRFIHVIFRDWSFLYMSTILIPPFVIRQCDHSLWNLMWFIIP